MSPKAYARSGLALGAGLLITLVAQTGMNMRDVSDARAQAAAYRKVVCAQGEAQSTSTSSIAVTNALQDYCR